MDAETRHRIQDLNRQLSEYLDTETPQRRVDRAYTAVLNARVNQSDRTHALAVELQAAAALAAELAEVLARNGL
jgi:hypothetical protein